MNWFERVEPVKARRQTPTVVGNPRGSARSVDASPSLARQAPTLGNHNLERLLRARLPTTSSVVQRKPSAPKDDPNQSVHSVDATGAMVPGATPTDRSEAVWRIPVRDLRGTSAVVLIPNVHVPTTPGSDVEVLLHFHGFGAGYQALEPGTRDYAGVLKPGQLRDIDLYQAEQQLLSLATAQQKFVIAILPQGSERSKFDNIPAHTDSFIRDVFARLIATGHLPTRTNPGNVIVSGHSGGGVPATSAATQRAAHGGRQDLLLFDAINFGCREKVCKTCTSNEYLRVSAWVTERIREDVRTHATAEKLKKSGTRFRALTHDRVDPMRDTCSYGHWYGRLEVDIDKAIAELHVTAEVAAQLHENFQVKQVTGAHEDVMGHGSLEAALRG